MSEVNANLSDRAGCAHHAVCGSIALNTHLAQVLPAAPGFYRMLVEERPHLLSACVVQLSHACLDQQQRIISLLEQTIALPGYDQAALVYAPETARFKPAAAGVFLGYDFHLSNDGPKLIEINSNAGGALVNAWLRRAHSLDDPPLEDFIGMFLTEWHLERGERPLRSIAIVDEDPASQYMYPEFLLFQRLFEQSGLTTVICDPTRLSHHNDRLWHDAQPIDLVYNRLTDFSLQDPRQNALRTAYLAGHVVLTPHPRNHALYADKRNLILLGDDGFLQTLGVSAENRAILCNGIARTMPVRLQDAETLWQQRRQLFFKPARGYGSKAAYRGDKLTRRVFQEIVTKSDYVAQALAQPSELHVATDDGDQTLKLDVRHYVYQGYTQLTCARLYQGQTTNFRTPGGGFAPIVIPGSAVSTKTSD